MNMAPHLTLEMFAIFATFATFAIFTTVAAPVRPAPRSPSPVTYGSGTPWVAG
jgi:hypothetical protein